MYNYDKIISELNKIERYITEPKPGTVIIGQFTGYATPSGFSDKFIEIKQENTTTVIKFHKQLQQEFQKHNINIGDHVGMLAKNKHKFAKWGAELVRWVVIKLKKVGDVYE